MPLDLGKLPDWGQDDLPEPLPFTTGNLFRTIGPGAILLAASIGGGEWMVGPAISVKYGTGLLWIATLAILLQLIFNLEGIRYTLYTGEPILTGILRLKPGSSFWASIYIVLAAAQLGIPALAAGCGTVLFTAWTADLPSAAGAGTPAALKIGIVAVTMAILLFGGTIERMLEYASWAMIAYIFAFLLVVNVVFVPAAHWGQTALGFLGVGDLPAAQGASGLAGMDMLLLASLAATAGSGGIGNLVISNWIRDKGFGMGAKVGAIPSAIGSRQIQLSHVGKVFPLSSENLRRWRLWWRYVEADQVVLWGFGCFLGMFLNVNLATAIAEPGTEMSAEGAGAYQAKYMAERLWEGLWYLGLLNGFWILFSTQLGNTDVLVRTVTDTVWVASSRARRWRGGSIALVYYSFLLLFTIWGMISVNWGHALDLFKVLGSLAGVVLSLAAVQILLVNTRLLPAALRPSWWRRVGLVLCAVFYGAFTLLVAWDLIRRFLLEAQ